MFHIPFEKRNIVSTQRFSIPGLPSLYLANSIYVAWEELKRPDYNQIQAVRLTNQRELNLLDLTTDIYREHSCSNVSNLRRNENELLNKVMVWPLIAACSIKVQHSSDPFKPEYIIPQLLMQWIKRERDVDGIKYSSTNINPSSKHNAHLYNVVIPVKSTKRDSGLCQDLIDIFFTTPTLPFQLKQFLIQSDHFSNQGSCHVNVNHEVVKIELIKGYPEDYFKTMFGVMEHTLKALDENPIAKVETKFHNKYRVRQRSFG
ncbi:RES domain-containing protein [Sphingobacterium siyangense]|uniref:RES domain-containing protein n=2 Tax=Sphingobacterium TaxID=28453 RepID=UPI003DA3DF95